MSLLDLSADTLNIICTHLTITDVKCLFASCKYLWKIASTPNITFYQYAQLSQIKNLAYYDNFTNIEMDTDKTMFQIIGGKHDNNNNSKERVLTKLMPIILREYNKETYYPRKITQMYFVYNIKLFHYMFPDNLTHLIFCKKFNQKIGMGVLPRRLTHLMLCGKYNMEIEENVLPEELIYLKFGKYFDCHIGPNVLPMGLVHLIFGRNFVQKIEANVLPKSLTHLTLGHWFNHEIHAGVLPISLTHLTLGYAYNHQINSDILPSRLTHLTLSDRFDRQIKPNTLPISLQILYVYKSYPHTIPSGNFVIKYI